MIKTREQGDREKGRGGRHQGRGGGGWGVVEDGGRMGGLGVWVEWS